VFAPEIYGYQYQSYDREKVRSWAIALGECFHRDDVLDFTRRLIQELCDSRQPQMHERDFWQLARWCQTGGAYERGMDYAQKISTAVFGRIIQRRDKAA